MKIIENVQKSPIFLLVLNGIFKGALTKSTKYSYWGRFSSISIAGNLYKITRYV